MASDFSQIVEHPDRDELISKLLTGTTPKDISNWLKLKYPKDKHLHITIKLLTEFSKSQYTDYYSNYKQDLAVIKSGGKINKNLASAVLNNKTYQERINEAADKGIEELDVAEIMKNSLIAITDRAIQVFDRIQENPRLTKNDYALIKWFELVFNALEKYDRKVNNAPDQIIQHNVTMQAMDDYFIIVQDTIREAISEIDPDLALDITERMSNAVAKLKPPVEQEENIDKRIKEAHVIKQEIIDLSKSLQDNTQID